MASNRMSPGSKNLDPPEQLRFQVVAGVFHRLLFTTYAGSGRLFVCWGRLSTMPACFKARRTVSSETRMPVRSAR
jgi:hypothetical protein